MEIEILSRREIENMKDYPFNNKTCIISISGSDEQYPAIKNYNCNKLFLKFDDIDTDIFADKYVLFTKEIAHKIFQFVDDNIRKENLPLTIFIHCHAGVCRSAAVGAALSKIFFNKDDHIFQTRVPNMRVYRIMLQEWFENIDSHKKYANINKIRYNNIDYRLYMKASL